MAEVYLLLSPVWKGYVGRTRTTADRRFRAHVYNTNHGATGAIHNAIRRYGSANIKIVLLAHGISWVDSAAAEQKWIARLGTLTPNGYNLTAGGEGKLQCPCSGETRAKIIAAKQGRPLSPETRARMSQALEGNHRVLGHRWQLSLERRRQISESNRQRKREQS